MMQMAKSVKNPRKQRERLFNAPAHARHKNMSAHLAPDLVKSHGIKSIPVRKGDTVRVMRGDHEGFEGKVSRVDLANYRIFVEGLTREKVDGTVIFISIHPSKVLIKTLNLDDKWRKRTLQRKKPLEQREESGLIVKPEEEEAKPAKAKAKPEEKKAKPKLAAAKRAAKPKAETSPEEKVEAPAEVKSGEKTEIAEEKPVVKKPRAAKKTVEKVEPPTAEEKAAETKPARKPRAKKTVEEAPLEERLEGIVESAETAAKKAVAKKTPAKRKPKESKETGGA